MRSANISRQLTPDDAIQIWRRRSAGEAQHVLAADFGVNPGRIAEVLTGRRFPEARALALAADGALTPGSHSPAVKTTNNSTGG